MSDNNHHITEISRGRKPQRKELSFSVRWHQLDEWQPVLGLDTFTYYWKLKTWANRKDYTDEGISVLDGSFKQPCTYNEQCQALGIGRTRLTRMIKTLYETGLLDIVEDERDDGNTYNVYIVHDVPEYAPDNTIYCDLDPNFRDWDDRDSQAQTRQQRINEIRTMREKRAQQESNKPVDNSAGHKIKPAISGHETKPGPVSKRDRPRSHNETGPGPKTRLYKDNNNNELEKNNSTNIQQHSDASKEIQHAQEQAAASFDDNVVVDDFKLADNPSETQITPDTPPLLKSLPLAQRLRRIGVSQRYISDIVTHSDFVQKHWEYFETQIAAGVISPKMIHWAVRNQWDFEDHPQVKQFYETKHRNARQQRETHSEPSTDPSPDPPVDLQAITTHEATMGSTDTADELSESDLFLTAYHRILQSMTNKQWQTARETVLNLIQDEFGKNNIITKQLRDTEDISQFQRYAGLKLKRYIHEHFDWETYIDDDTEQPRQNP